MTISLPRPGQPDRSLLRLSVLALLLLGSGCASIPLPSRHTADDTRHHLILGFGVISVRQPKDQALTVTNSNVLGLHVTDEPNLKASFGYSSGVTTSVGDGAEDVRIEVGKKPWKEITIDVVSARLRGTTAGNTERTDAAMTFAEHELRAEVVELSATQ